MADERTTPSGWLPPVAPGARPPAPARRPAFAKPDPAIANTPAVWALVLAVTGLALLLVSLGTLFILTLPCSAGAWILAARGRARLERGETSYGEGQAAAALWIARIGVIAGVAAMVIFIGLLASGFDLEQFRDDLQRELDRRQSRPDDGDGPSDGVRASIAGLRALTGR
ncbi:MAG: hypothetical protein ACR2L8_00780 [Solirubrobacteraceae bacterium]